MATKKAAKKVAKKAVKKAPKKKAKEQVPAEELPEPKRPTVDEIFEALPAKQQAFVLEYFANGFNATKAAIAAGYSAKTADSQASRLLKDVKVAAVIADRRRMIREDKEISAKNVLQNIADLAELDPRKLWDEDGNLRPIHKLPLDVARCITSVNVLTTKSGDLLTKIKFADVGQNNERLGRHLKLFTDQVEHFHKIERVVLKEAIKKERPLPPSKPDF